MYNENWIFEKINFLKNQHQYRELQNFSGVGGKIILDGKECLDFSSNDYLNFSNHPEMVAATVNAVEKYGVSAAASRLVTGNFDCHVTLEQRLAAFKQYPAALIFGSGWLANISIIPALITRDDQIFMDKLCHASLVDAALLSKAKIFRFQHNDSEHLAQLLKTNAAFGRKLIVTESVFSMDGDLAPLVEIAAIAKQYDAMVMVDEAHATGIFGKNGRGLVNELGLTTAINISMGTCSKALGSYGGFVVCSETMRDYLINFGRGFIFATAPPPASVAASITALKLLQLQPDCGRTLLLRAKKFRNDLKLLGFNIGDSQSHIIPIIIGSNAETLKFAEQLKRKGIIGIPIRPPTVPKKQARIRLVLNLAHDDAILKYVIETIGKIAL
jgi:8-amino-7-oxononanoate synthase